LSSESKRRALHNGIEPFVRFPELHFSFFILAQRSAHEMTTRSSTKKTATTTKRVAAAREASPPPPVLLCEGTAECENAAMSVCERCRQRICIDHRYYAVSSLTELPSWRPVPKTPAELAALQLRVEICARCHDADIAEQEHRRRAALIEAVVLWSAALLFVGYFFFL
jgi:hypothetical protein